MTRLTHSVFLSTGLLSYALAVLVDYDGRRIYNSKKKYGTPAANSYFEMNQNPAKTEYYSYPYYEFEYAISDKKTGDHKKHKEWRDGDTVKGEYSLIEPDGNLRKVSYHANDKDGFNAFVTNAYNKHGDHAVSVVGRRSQFGPNGFDINSPTSTNYQKILHNFNLYNSIMNDPIKPTSEEKIENYIWPHGTNKQDEITEKAEDRQASNTNTDSENSELNAALNQMKELMGSKIMTSIIQSIMNMDPKMKPSKMTAMEKPIIEKSLKPVLDFKKVEKMLPKKDSDASESRPYFIPIFNRSQIR